MTDSLCEGPRLIAASRAGSRSALDLLIRHYHGQLFGFVLPRCRTTEDAQDALQDTLLGLLRSIGSFREESRFSTWRYTIAANVCMKRYRRGLYDHMPEQLLSLEELPPCIGAPEWSFGIADWTTNAEQCLLRAELAERIERAIARLPEAYRTVVVLRDVEGRSTEETAECLCLSVSAVKSRPLRARVTLRRALAAYRDN